MSILNDTDSLRSLLLDTQALLLTLPDEDTYICAGDGYEQSIEDLLARIDEVIMALEKEGG